MEKTLKVTGKGILEVKPDITIIRVELKKTEKTYQKAMEMANEEGKALKELLSKVGINKDTIKTTRFSIEPHYLYYKDSYGNNKSKIDGYTFDNELEFKFDIDNKLLGAVLYQIASCKTSSNVDIKYSYKDVEKAKNMLLKNAVADAVQKAEILSMASNVKLKNIVSINYSFDDLSFEISPFNRRYRESMITGEYLLESSSYDMDIDPEDITLRDSVTIVWSIE